MTMMRAKFTRRNLIVSIAAVTLAPAAVVAGQGTLHVAKSPTCGCCGAWIEHMRRAGFQVEVADMDYEVLQAYKTRLGVAPELSSCHTAQVEGYVVEGHVPAEDVKRLLRERPEAIGLSVPGMPVGSPGMEMNGDRDQFDVVLLKTGGGAAVFQRYR